MRTPPEAANERDPRLVELTHQLRTGTEANRVLAAEALARSEALPGWCAPALVEALGDGASTSQAHSDWDGTVLLSSTSTVKAHAAEALRKVGSEALEPLSKHPGHRALLAELVAALTPDALAQLSPELRATLPPLLGGTRQEQAALRALAWRDDAARGEEARQLARLEHPEDTAVIAACTALAAQSPSRAAANAVVRRLARGSLSEAVAPALATFAPLADDEALGAFLQGRVMAPRDAPDDALLRTVATWGPRASRASAALMALFMTRLWPYRPNQVGQATSAAQAVAGVVGAPTSAADPRVALFLAARATVRGEDQPPGEVLELLVLACTGGQALAPFVLQPLIEKLVEGSAAARVDAAQRLSALGDASAPAGAALVTALEAAVEGRGEGGGVSAIAWALAHAGEARALALPRFIAMLEGRHASAALHGLNGMSAHAAAAIPALEALLARTTVKWERQNVERTLKRVRFLSKRG